MHYVGSWLSTISKTIFWVNNRQNEVKFLFESIAAQRNIYQVEMTWEDIERMVDAWFTKWTSSHLYLPLEVTA